MTAITPEKLQTIIEAALMVAGHPLTITSLQALFEDKEKPSNADIKTALAAISARHTDSGIELKEVASGFRLQAKPDLSPWLSKLWEERAPRYSRAFLETLALIAYRQPITRGEIEEIRGVTVSSNIMKTLQEREWIRALGVRDVPGKPTIYGTTKTFLDHFNLKSLTDMPTLAEFKNIEAQEAKLQVELALENSNIAPSDSEVIPEEKEAIVNEEENVISIDDTNEIQQDEIMEEEKEEAEAV